MASHVVILLALFYLLTTEIRAFSPCRNRPFSSRYTKPTRGTISPQLFVTTKPTTLTDETTWRLRFLLKGVPTTNGKKVDDLFVVEAKFLEEEGYEPPQGSLRQILQSSKEEESNEDNSNDDDDDDESTRRVLEIASGQWQLSEDPNDRKDGLWIWGLFEEPLYPFMLLKIETRAVNVPGQEGDSIKPLVLYAQISHSRNKETGVELKGTTLNVREKETLKADPFGAATVDINNDIDVGRLTIEPVFL